MSIPVHHRRLGFTEAPGEEVGQGITVAVLDGGVAPVSAFSGRLERIDSAGRPDQDAPTEHATRCASLIAAHHDDAWGVAPGASILSINVSRDGAADPDHVARAFDLLTERAVPVTSCSFVLEHISSGLRRAVDRYVSAGHLLIGAAANAKERQAFEFVRAVPGTIRVFSGPIPLEHDEAEHGAGASAVSLDRGRYAVVGVDGRVDPRWPGQSSAATALVAGLAARSMFRGVPPPEIRDRLIASDWM